MLDKFELKKKLDLFIRCLQNKKLIDAEQTALSIIHDYPNQFHGWKALGIVQLEKGQISESIKTNKKALLLAPNDFEIHNNIGIAFDKINKVEKAISSFEIAISLKPDFVYAIFNLGNTLKKMNKFNEAIKNYEKAIILNPNIPEIYNNLGISLEKLFKFDTAILNYKKAILLKPNFTEAYFNIANTQKKIGQLEIAISNYKKAILLKPNFLDAYFNLGLVFEKKNEINNAILVFKKGLEIDPKNELLKNKLIYIKMSICDFNIYNDIYKISSKLGIITKSITPFPGLLWEDNPKNQYLRNKKYSQEKFGAPNLNIFKNRDYKNIKKIKVGYFSSDFHNFPTMNLMIGILENHDKFFFEIYAFSYGLNKKDSMQNRVAKSVNHFIELNEMNSQDIIKLVRNLKIDIAIDLNGYTENSNNKIFHQRLSPIQINYLGYPSTTGSHFMDYIVADKIVIPENFRKYYSEKIIFMPNCYQPNDNKRKISLTNTKKNDFGLPEDAFVYCCFNNPFKISPIEFKIWMKILKKKTNSVLWLVKSNNLVVQNLIDEAKKYNINPKRLVFAEKISYAEHLARHKHADLFLDTFNYNAHTTASDALWCGLPIITKQGKQFSARSTSSLLQACGLPELITLNHDDYESLILDYSHNQEKLKIVKNKLVNNLKNNTLFNTKLYTDHFEMALKKVFKNYTDGILPKDIYIN